MSLAKLCPFLRQRKLLLTDCKLLAFSPAARLKGSSAPRTDLVASKPKSELDTNVKPVVESVKTVSYLGVILVGIGVTGALFYGVFSELFSGKSPNSVYTKAYKQCINDTRVQDCLGEPIMGFGEETRRGRRRHVHHTVYEKDGVKHMRMKFYLQGAFKKGNVLLEMFENESGKYEYRFLLVQAEDYTHTTIILEDNRAKADRMAKSDLAINF